MLRKTIPPKVVLVENDMRENAAVFIGDGFDAPYIAAAYYLIAQFVSKEAADEYWGEANDGVMSSETGSKLVTLGETLFRLQRTPGLIEFCDRIRTKSPRDSFYNEALVASVFLDHGFSIRALQETGTKGFDFDFRAKRNGTSVCVEVTTLRQTKISDNTLHNALRAKMGQLPKNKPNVIVCLIPEAWYDAPDVTERLYRQARRLFGSSQRINAVVYIGEQHDNVVIGGEQFGTLQYRFTPVLSEKARNACGELSFLWEMKGDELARSGALSEFQDQASVHYAVRGQRPFFQWVDALIGRSQ